MSVLLSVLSHNNISVLGEQCFKNLPVLHTLLLDHNLLTSQVLQGGALTNLTRIEVLALGHNLISMTLYNGRRMVCVSADNPAVTTVFELTEANCIPSNQNITVRIEPRSSVTPQLYARDLAITAVICFIGGVGLTLLVVLIYYQVSKKKKLKKSKRQKTEEEGSSTTQNHHVNHLNVSEKRRERSLQANSSQPWDREIMTMDPRRDGHGRQIRTRLDENSSHFVCSECSSERQRGMGPNPMRWNNRINGGMEAEEEIEKKRVRMVAEEERRRLGNQQGILTRDIPNKFLSHGNTNSFSHPRKEAFSDRPETLASYRESGESYRTDIEGKNRGQESLHCQSCHSTYRPPEQNTRQGRNHTNMRDSPLFEGLPSQYRQIDRDGNVNHSQFDIMKNAELRRETRNVTFDLERSRTLEGNSHGNDKREDDERTSRDKERLKRHKAKVQSSRLLKVKLNLNPLRKSKVHPKRKAEQGHSEKKSSKKSKDKRQDGKDRGDKEGKGKSAVNPAPGQSVLQTQLPPDSSITKLKSDPAQGPGLQTGKGVQQLPPESQTPQTKESHTLPTQAPPSAEGSTTLQAPSIAEKLSSSTSQTEAGLVPAGSTVNTSTAVLTEGLAAGVSGDSMQAADGSVLGVSAPSMSTQSVSSIDDAGPTAALLQQEYLSEEGGSSPRRK
ncbi:hypothetical protein GBF38_016059, partial [Nibea albiflora]